MHSSKCKRNKELYTERESPSQSLHCPTALPESVPIPASPRPPSCLHSPYVHKLMHTQPCTPMAILYPHSDTSLFSLTILYILAIALSQLTQNCLLHSFPSSGGIRSSNPCLVEGWQACCLSLQLQTVLQGFIFFAYYVMCASLSATWIPKFLPTAILNLPAHRNPPGSLKLQMPGSPHKDSCYCLAVGNF